MELPHILGCRLLCSSILFYLTLFSSILFFSSLSVESATVGNETDRLALLAFKDLITGDPNGALASWNDSLHFCEWKGVTCGRRHRERVTILYLAHQGLEGSTSPSIANLSFLHKIHLENNSFYGQLPHSVFRLPRLRYLYLNNNSYQGEIPANLTTQLQELDLQYNELVGIIPDDLHSLSMLTSLNLCHNRLRGSIPPSLGNLSSLTLLYVEDNNLTGSIPYDFARLVKLKFLNLESNRLSGTVPPPLFNLSSIVIFVVANNHLQGSLPPYLGLTLPSLEKIDVGLNQFTGAIPNSLPNASQLVFLGFGHNDFSGSVPINLGSLLGLNYLSVSNNQLGGRDNADDLMFLNSLVNCSGLEILRMGQNNLKGVLPNTIANFSNQLTYLTAGSNQIFGTIPLGIENLVSLNKLTMHENSIRGPLPFGIGKLNKLEVLWLAENELSGSLPTSLSNLTMLIYLNLSANNLIGNIPLSIKNCWSIQVLSLESNKLNGTIPIEIFNLPSLSVYLNLSHNSFMGTLPSEVGNLNTLTTLDISYNNLSGEIPSSLSNCLSLEYLHLEHNNFHGTIPSLSTLKGIREMSLSHNNLSAPIPIYLKEVRALEYLDLSFNDLEGEVPKEGIFANASASLLEGNNLCGGISELHLPACPSQVNNEHGRASSRRVIILTASAIFCLILTSFLVVVLHWRRKSRKKPHATSFLDDQLLKVSYIELHRATNGFSTENLIGAGSYGSVYKGTLEIIEKIVAVKVFNLQTCGASESFKVECEALRNTRHRNLVKVLTSCSSIDFNGNDFKALVFEYMPNGSLETWLHQDEGAQHSSRKLTFLERLNIAIDVASALNYLHNHGEVPIVHRDLKPSNILFDDDMNAHVGDFGLAKLLFGATNNCFEDKTNSSMLKGTIGYVAPEYGMGSKASTQGDVYSFGILLLEIFTRKAPTDDMFKNGLDLYQFAKIAFPDQLVEITDTQLLLEVEVSYINSNNQESSNMRNWIHDFLIPIFKIGLSCCAESPRERMVMSDVIREMIAIKDLYLGMGVYQQR